MAFRFREGHCAPASLGGRAGGGASILRARGTQLALVECGRGALGNCGGRKADESEPAWNGPIKARVAVTARGAQGSARGRPTPKAGECRGGRGDIAVDGPKSVILDFPVTGGFEHVSSGQSCCAGVVVVLTFSSFLFLVAGEKPFASSKSSRFKPRRDRHRGTSSRFAGASAGARPAVTQRREPREVARRT